VPAVPLLGALRPPELVFVTPPEPCVGVLPETTSPGFLTVPPPVGISIFPELRGLT